METNINLGTLILNDWFIIFYKYFVMFFASLGIFFVIGSPTSPERITTQYTSSKISLLIFSFDKSYFTDL